MAFMDRFRRQQQDPRRQQMDPRTQQPQPGMPPQMNMMDMQRMRRREAPDPGSPAPAENNLDRLVYGRTPEEDDAFRMGERMGAEGLAQMNGITPLRMRTQKYRDDRMTRDKLIKATEILMKYKAGKESVNKRVISAQQWWKLKNWEEIKKNRGVKASTVYPSNTGWLWNCIVGKHADAMDSYPEPIFLPRAQDDEEEAKKLSKIVPVVLEMNDFEETYNDCMWQKMQEGTGVYGVFWNSKKLNGLGDIDIKKVNILNLYWEPGIQDIQDSRDVFYVSFEDKENLIRQYPDLEGQLTSNRLSIEKYKTDDDVDLSEKAPVVDWYYKVMDGDRAILHYCKFVGENLLYSSEEEGLTEGYYADGQYPFVLDALYPVEGSPAGYGYIDIARDTQTDIDTLSQAMVKNAAVRATPRYFMSKACGVNENEFTDTSKPIVHTNGNMGQDAVKPIEVQDMGSDAHNMLQQKIDEIKFITGNTDVNNGGVPSGVTAASAIAALKEDSGRSSKDSTKASYRSYRKLLIMVVERFRQFYDIPRQFRITGESGETEQFVTYSNMGLKEQTISNGGMMEDAYRLPLFDIEVRAQRENAYTKMSQNELALQFWGLGAFNPQATDQVLMLLDMMEFRGKEELVQKIQQQGTLQEGFITVSQIALALGQQYDPVAAQQVAQLINQYGTRMGGQPAGGGQPAQVSGMQTAPDDNMSRPHEANENKMVRRAAERSANASRPS